MTDYNFLMESRLSPAQFQLVNELGRIAYREGISLYLVGGAVRDMTFGQAVVRDLDFAAEGNIHKILRHLLPGKAKEARSSASTWVMGPGHHQKRRKALVQHGQVWKPCQAGSASRTRRGARNW